LQTGTGGGDPAGPKHNHPAANGEGRNRVIGGATILGEDNKRKRQEWKQLLDGGKGTKKKKKTPPSSTDGTWAGERGGD